MQTIQDSGIVQVPLEDFPILVANVLSVLGYDHILRASAAFNQIIAVQRVEQRINRNVWSQEWKVILRWKAAAKGGIQVSIELLETKGGGTTSEATKRTEALFDRLENDAKHLTETKSSRAPSTIYGSASWGSQKDLETEGYVTKEVDAKRFILGRTESGNFIQVPERNTYAHTIVCGRTGTGKSTGFFIPQLVERIGTSMIVTEATPGPERGELYQLTSGWRKNAGNAIYCFNPSDMSSHRINPLDRVRLAPDNQKVKRAAELADLIIMNGQPSESRGETKMWNDAERHLLTSLLLYTVAGDPKDAHLGFVRWLVLKGPSEIVRLIKRTPSEIAQMEFEGWLRLSGETNFKYGVFSGLNTKFAPWQTDQIVTLTETTDIDLEALTAELFTLYIAVYGRSNDGKLIGALILNFIIGYLLENRAKMKYPITMLLDEFTNFGKIQGISDFLSLVRKNKIGLVLGFQNYSQLEQVYSRLEAQTIVDQPQTQIYFKQKGYREAKDLSEALGRTTVESSTLEDSGRVREVIQARNLATPDELIAMKSEVIVFTASVNALKLPLTKPDFYEAALQYAPPSREEHEVSEYVQRRGRVSRPVEKEAERESDKVDAQPESKTNQHSDRFERPGAGRPRSAAKNNEDEDEEEQEDATASRYKKPLEDWE